MNVTMRKIYNILFCLCVLLVSDAYGQNIKNGYPGKSSYFPGDTAEIFISGFSGISHATLYLLDAADNRADSVVTDLHVQFPANPNPWQNGFGYTCTFKYIVPKLKSGLYTFDDRVFFIVKSRDIKSVTVVFPSNTFEAYDSSGGKSLYCGNSTGLLRSQVVSFQRARCPGLIFWLNEIRGGVLSWLISQPDIDYKVISDMDLDDYSEIHGSQLLMVVGHSEYWTRKARRNFDGFVNAGGHAAILGGNTMCTQVRYSDDLKQLLCYRDSASDPGVDSLKTIYWTDPRLHYPVIASIGVDWRHGGMGTEKPHGWNGYKITKPNSPVFSGTGLNMGDTLICNSSEYDGAPLAGFDEHGFPVLDTGAMGFCKAELIGYDYGKNALNNRDTAFGTFIVLRKNLNTGVIVNTAFNECTYKGPPVIVNGENPHPTGFGGKDAEKMKRIFRNIVDLLLSGQNIFSTPVNGGVITRPDTTFASALFIDSGAAESLQWQYSATSANGPFTDITQTPSDSLFFKFNNPGNYWIRSHLVNGDCQGYSANVKKVFVADSLKAIKSFFDIDLIPVVSIWPVPSNDKVIVSVQMKYPGQANISVYDIRGSLIMPGETLTGTNLRFELHFENEASGIYFAHITIGDMMWTRRIVIGK